ncbi:LOW QUALITY PROTEIN: putative serine/threonine-protein kinase fhkD [Dermatophagoides farinae]|uniref:LOW QUALITY PROTEIN: putative serine/threonine-protein kinase fhkD n=1 Tax=Dermatophagoides farinae TaxID=6954 RepID=UPI003F601635
MEQKCSILSGCESICPRKLLQMKRKNLKCLIHSGRMEQVLFDSEIESNESSYNIIIDKRVEFKRSLYHGHYSDVYLIQSKIQFNRKLLRKNFVAKIVNVDWCPKYSNYENEIQICNFIKDNPHPNIIEIVNVLQFERFTAILMPYGGQQNLLEFLKCRSNSTDDCRISLSVAKSVFFKQLTAALGYLHTNHIVHRDINNNNNEQALCSSHKGVLEYMAPELLANCLYYDAYKTDIYSLGVIFYLLIYGHCPFELDDNLKSTQSFEQNLHYFRQMKQQPIQLSSLENNDQDLQDLLKQMLNIDPKQRPSIGEIISTYHVYFGN